MKFKRVRELVVCRWLEVGYRVQLVAERHRFEFYRGLGIFSFPENFSLKLVSCSSTSSV